MVYDEGLASRVREVLQGRKGVTEKKMFGGLTFMLADKMCVGILGDDLMVRVGREAHEAALAEPHARPMDFTGRNPRGFVFVDPKGLETAGALESWVDRAVKFLEAGK